MPWLLALHPVVAFAAERMPDAVTLDRIEVILETLGAPLDLRTLGLQPADFGFVAKQAMLATRLTANNPRELTVESVTSILERGYDGDRSWWQL